MKIDYKNATLEQVAAHYKESSKQVIYQSRKLYEGDSEVHAKLEQALVMAKIARLKDELGVLENSLKIHSETSETHCQSGS